MIMIIIMYAPWDPKIVYPRPIRRQSSSTKLRFGLQLIPHTVLWQQHCSHTLPCCTWLLHIEMSNFSNFSTLKSSLLLTLRRFRPQTNVKFHLSKHSKQNCWCPVSVSTGKANPYNCAIWLVDGAGEAFSGLVASCNSCAKPGQGRLMAEVWE